MENNDELTFRRFQQEKSILTPAFARRAVDNVELMIGFDRADLVLAYPAECVIFQMRISETESEYYMPGYVDYKSNDLEDVERKLFAFFIEEGLEF